MENRTVQQVFVSEPDESFQVNVAFLPARTDSGRPTVDFAIALKAPDGEMLDGAVFVVPANGIRMLIDVLEQAAQFIEEQCELQGKAA